VLDASIPHKGRVLTQLSAFWFRRLASLCDSHFITADTDEIIAEIPALGPHRSQVAGRSMLVKRTSPVEFECVVRGYLAGSAWSEYRRHGTLAGEPLPAGMVESSELEPPIFSPATKAHTGHDENVTFSRMVRDLGEALATRLRDLSVAIYAAGRDVARERGLLIADTKFEFGIDPGGNLLLIDEVLTPDSSRFWPVDQYQPGRSQPSFDKQPLRDWLAGEREAGRWNGESPAPALPRDVIEATSARYIEAYQRLTGSELPAEDRCA
jgi:phosphoribosylaminoimidazole-succinocarboxamide synthase